MSISVRDLHFAYARRQALDALSVHAPAGRVTALLGPNAAGKSTLLRCVIGALKPARGTVLMDDTPVRRMSRRELAGRLAYVSQRSAVSARFSVREVIELGRYALPRDPDRIDAAIEQLALEALVDRPYPELSVGQQQRVMLARALLRQPDLLVLDEPMSGVDVAGQGELYSLIERIRERYGCGVLLISHDLHVVMAATDRVVCLNHHVCCTGRPDSIVAHPEFRALFGAAVADRLAIYHHHHDHAHDASGDIVPLTEIGHDSGAVPS